jgi:hypothetical protein
VDMLVTGIPLLRRVKIAECLHGSAVGHGSILDVGECRRGHE